MKQNKIISALMRGSSRDRESTTTAAANPASWSLTPSGSGTCGNVILRSGANQKNPRSDEVVPTFDKVLSTQELNHARRKEDDACPRTSAGISSRYESKGRGLDRYPDGIEKRANSPKGIVEFDVEDICETTEHCNPVMINATDFSFRSPHAGDTCTDMSSSLFEFDNDSHSKQSSSLLDAEACSVNVSGFSTNYVEDLTAYGSSTPERIASSAASYLFELAGDGNKQRRTTQFGVGQNSKSSSRPKKLLQDAEKSTSRRTPVRKLQCHRIKNPNADSELANHDGLVQILEDQNSKSSSRPGELLQDAATRRSAKEKSTSRRAHVCKLQCHRMKNPNADSELTNHDGLIQISDEISGLCLDAKSAFVQVLYAFFISPDDIDQISDTLSNAKIELVEMCHDQTKIKK